VTSKPKQCTVISQSIDSRKWYFFPDMQSDVNFGPYDSVQECVIARDKYMRGEGL